ncbi:MAG: S8 family serine peptidase [Holophaga sp.]|nr:S8 family serine peptidase [Holophaga sp.]
MTRNLSSRTMHRIFILGLATGMTGFTAWAQVSPKRTSVDLFAGKPGEVRTGVITPQGIKAAESLTIEGPVDVIVQLKETPLLNRRRAVFPLTSSQKSQAMRDHQLRIQNEHQQVRGWIVNKEGGLRNQDFKEFRFTFNGLATRVSHSTFQQLKDHPAVAHVFRDTRVHATLSQSVPLIGATQMWNNYGATGQGIRVAILDSGIDYNHPDLGGGYGSGYKVIGGYDFVNNDTDPMDDHGHGTHVAGIIAANGLIKGVAPNAKLLAFKVLGADGSGAISGIIAALDLAADPDQDPMTDDKVNVINMSLGGPGDADDPISQAVDAAVDAGIVCVVAAGNEGSSYATIGSPGCARKAITVGATDNLDQIALFSSRGPGRPDMAIKPDVTAPGVNINSSLLGGGYGAMSGTSMAAPHVAGAAALLLEKHPTWLPEFIKGALTGTAKDLGLDAFTQGSGRVQIQQAYLTKAVASPSNLSFGPVDIGQPIWAKTSSVRIHNLDASDKNYSLSMEGSWPSGVSWSIVPALITIGPGQSKDVSITLTVDNSALPFGPVPSSGLGGWLVAQTSNDSLRLPVSFSKFSRLELQFDQFPNLINIYDKNDNYKIVQPYLYYQVGNAMLVALYPGNYDILCYFPHGPNGERGESFIIKEGVIVNNNTVLGISLKNEAIHHINLTGVDADGNDFNLINGMAKEAVFGPITLDGAIITRGEACTDYYFSDVSNSYKFETILSGWSSNSFIKKYYEFRYGLINGIFSSQSLTNSPVSVVKLNYNISPNVNSAWISFLSLYQSGKLCRWICVDRLDGLEQH